MAAEIVIATHNLHKVREFREMFKSLKNLDVLSLVNFPEYIPPEETGKNFQENATMKAVHASKALNKWVLADNSGLVVPALKGRPGTVSKRYAGEDATDTENRKKLLTEMSSMDGIERTAYFECCLALASPEGIKKIVTGKCEGQIIQKNGVGTVLDMILFS